LYKIPARTLFIGKKLVFVPECHSTNTLANELSENTSVPEGTVILTDHQTAGRGQRGNSWETAPASNLTLSIVINPKFLSVKDHFFLNIFTSLTIHDLLRDKLNATVNIKWPNDIMVNGKKICGILIENQIQGHEVSKAVVGIGLNVNQTIFSTPSATSMALESDHAFNREEVLDELCSLFETRYLQLRQGKLNELHQAYLGSLYWRDEKRTFETQGGEFSGVISGVDRSGKLVVATASESRLFDLKEIKYVR
jgi:BirA family transcriptional regulator, biotin operon repressor / biotin---[acetyl-CoA-carboxylase] ligase